MAFIAFVPLHRHAISCPWRDYPTVDVNSLHMPSDYAVRTTGLLGNKYVVRNRTELGDEVLVRLECCWSKPCAQVRFVEQISNLP